MLVESVECFENTCPLSLERIVQRAVGPHLLLMQIQIHVFIIVSLGVVAALGLRNTSAFRVAPMDGTSAVLALQGTSTGVVCGCSGVVAQLGML